MQSEEIGTSYTCFDSLESTTILFESLVDMLYSTNWKDSFLAIDQLRAISKFRWDEFCAKWSTVSTKLIELTDSPRSTLAKNALVLASECFITPRPGIEILVGYLLPVLLVKSMNEKSFIRGAAITGVDRVLESFPSDITAEILTSFCFHKAGALCDYSYSKLSPLLRQIHPAGSFSMSVKLMDSKRKTILRGARDHLLELKRNWGEFEEHERTLGEAQQEKLQRSLANSNKAPTRPFREYIRNVKKSHQQPEFKLV